MSIRGWITGKQYVLVNRSTGDEEVGTFPASRTMQQIKAMISAGDLEDGVYRLICRSRKGDKAEWTMPAKKVLTAARITAMERANAFKALREKTESVKRDVEDLRVIKTQMLKEFGDDTGTLQEEIELPEERLSLMDAISRATAESTYISIRRNPDKTTDALFSVIEAGTNILTGVGNMIALNVAGKTAKHADSQVRTMDTEVEIKGDKKTIRFKKPIEEEAESTDVEAGAEEGDGVETEVAPEEDDIEYDPKDTELR